MIGIVFSILFLVMGVCYVVDLVCTVKYLKRSDMSGREKERIAREFGVIWVLVALLLSLGWYTVEGLVDFITDIMTGNIVPSL